jgi:C-terminal processing protease CtpA/Prc
MKRELTRLLASVAAGMLLPAAAWAQIGDANTSSARAPSGHVASPDNSVRDESDSSQNSFTRDDSSTRTSPHTDETDRETGATTRRYSGSGSGSSINSRRDTARSGGSSRAGIGRSESGSASGRDSSASSRDTTQNSRATVDTGRSARDTRETSSASRSSGRDTSRSDSRDTARTADRDSSRSDASDSSQSDARDSSRRDSSSDSRDTARNYGSARDRNSDSDDRQNRSYSRDAGDQRSDRSARDRYYSGGDDRSNRSDDRSSSRDSDDRYASDRDDSDRRSGRDASDRSYSDSRNRDRDGRDDGYSARDRRDDPYNTARRSSDSDRNRGDYDRYSRDDRSGSDRATLRNDVRNTVQSARDTFRDARDTARSTARGVRDSVSTSRSSQQFDASSVHPADMGLWFNRNTSNGLVISDIGSSGPISRVGFREGDRIVSVNGTRVANQNQFMQYLFADDVINSRVPVVVARSGGQQTLYVEPSVLVDQYTTVQRDPLDQFGVTLDDRYYDRLVVWKVIPRTPAYYAGVRAGDTLWAWDGQRLARPDDLMQAIDNTNSSDAQLTVYRGRQARELEVDTTQLAARDNAHTSYRPALEGNASTVVGPTREFGTDYNAVPATGVAVPAGTYVDPAVPLERGPGVFGGPGILPRGGILPRNR